MNNTIFSQISSALVECQKEEVLKLTAEALQMGEEPLHIVNQALVAGMDIVGQKYESEEYFLPHLILAADAMQQAIRLLEPELRKRSQHVESRAVVVIGTVAGDIHEIGKTLVATMLSANGYEVHDLGVDVPVEKFIEKAQQTNATIIGLSALLTTTMTVQRELIHALEQNGIREKVKVIVGGAPVSQVWAETIHADGYAQDALAAVRLVNQLCS